MIITMAGFLKRVNVLLRRWSYNQHLHTQKKIHPPIFICLAVIMLWGLQSKQIDPDFLVLSNFFLVFPGISPGIPRLYWIFKYIYTLQKDFFTDLFYKHVFRSISFITSVNTWLFATVMRSLLSFLYI